jgi:hypothetical protein
MARNPKRLLVALALMLMLGAAVQETNPVSCRYAGGVWTRVTRDDGTHVWLCVKSLSAPFQRDILNTIADMEEDASAPAFCAGIFEHVRGDLAEQVAAAINVREFLSTSNIGGFHDPRFDSSRRNGNWYHYAWNRRDWGLYGKMSVFHEAAHHMGYDHDDQPSTASVTEDCLSL